METITVMKPANKINTQFDIPEMMNVYKSHRNYEILEFNNDDDRCVIFFSGNGLYYPNDPETFHRVILENNRFEWKKNITRFANKVIFLRDVTKSWYLEGINININTIEKLACFLEEQTHGLKVICVGNSAGGYAATLFGCLLNASHTFNFSGQYSLLHMLQTEHDRALNPTLVKYENIEEYRKYFSIVDYIKTSKTPVFYFFPAKCDEDIAQSKLVENIKSVYEFKFNTNSHASTCFEINFLDIFSQSRENVQQLQLQYKNSLISPLLFSIKTSGLARSFNYLVKSEMISIVKHI
jgi:hypothetical protein